MRLKYFFTGSIVFTLVACKKSFDLPPLRQAGETGSITIHEMKKRLVAPSSHFRFSGGDTNLYCTVIADETSGNLFRQVYVRDDQGDCMQMRLVSDGGLYTGDRIRINLNHTYIVIANNMVYLDSASVQKNVVKLSSGNEVQAKLTTMGNVLAAAFLPLEKGSWQSQLVEFNGVEFDAAVRGKPFADAVGKTTGEYLLRDCGGRMISVRTSGRCNFASKAIPSGNGRIVAIVSQYDSEMQLTIRNYTEVKMNDPPCTSLSTGTVPNTATFTIGAPVATISETFSDVAVNVTFEREGWINYNELGGAKWKGNVKAGTYRALKASSYGTAENNSMWLISPPVIWKDGLKLSFKTGIEFYSPGHDEIVAAYISTSYNGANFAAANWTRIDGASFANGLDVNYTGPLGLKSSGDIDLKTIGPLKSYSGNFFVAFRYTGDPAHTSNIYLDDVVIK